MIVAKAPGRLDVMGGIADYSGSLVLQLPLAREVTVALNAQTPERANAHQVEVTSRRGPNDERFQWTPGERVPREPSWAPYVAGVIQWCHERAPARLRVRAFDLRIKSTVPEGKGVASSAALEVACMKAVAEHWGLELTGPEIAAACQWVENNVAGAPCGIMDQMTAACGEPGRLFRLLCQPAIIEGHVDIPADYRFFGIDSGIRHAVTGADYATVRTAAFMGLRIVTEMDPHAVPGGYLANLHPERFARFESLLPDRMSGHDFLHLHQGVNDPASTVVRDRLYPVCQATKHPVMEHQRVTRFAELLTELPSRPEAAIEAGELMYASHRSYSDCGLGSAETDRIVAAVAEAGPSRGLFGAKITGGGSGGTVCILGNRQAATAVHRIAAGRDVFEG